MRVGLNSNRTNRGTLDRLVDEVREAAECGLASAWVPNYFGAEALTSLAVVGREVPGIALGTAVMPIFTRHPFAMAQQALTVQAATGGRLTLGLGLSHRAIVEGAWGLDYARPADRMEHYLEDLDPLLDPRATPPTGSVPVEVEPISPRVPGGDRPDVVVAALGPRMIDIAGRLSDGAVLYCVGPAGLAASVPRLAAAAEAASRRAPRVVVSLPVCVTRDADAARSRIAERLSTVDTLPSYRRSLDLEGVSGIADLAIVGRATTVRDAIHRLSELGVTEFIAMIDAADEVEYRSTIEALAAIIDS